MSIVFNTVAKPSGSLCNLSCKYCFYLDKPRGQRVMSDDVLETYIRRVIDDTPSSEVSFCWQGGEPTLCGLSFYQKVVRLQQRYANGKTIYNSLQTNGVLINEEWAAFFAQHQFLIGISIDGPQVVHDNYRKTPSGRASFSRVVNAIRLLQANDVEFNTLTVVNDVSCRHGNAIYHFLTQELESKHLQFIPIVEPLAQKTQRSLTLSDNEDSPSLMPFSVTPEGWGAFMCDVLINGYVTMSDAYSYSFLTTYLASGWGSPPRFVRCSRPAGKVCWWSRMATCLAVTILFFPPINWAICSNTL